MYVRDGMCVRDGGESRQGGTLTHMAVSCSISLFSQVQEQDRIASPALGGFALTVRCSETVHC